MNLLLHIVIFDNFVKSMMSYLSKLKVTPIFCFAFKIPDHVTTTTNSYAEFALGIGNCGCLLFYEIVQLVPFSTKGLQKSAGAKCDVL